MFPPVHIKNDAFSTNSTFETVLESFLFYQCFRAFLVWMINENASNLCSFNRKRISVDGASDNELSLSFLGNSRTSELRVRV